MRTLWVNSDHGNILTPIDPRTGRRGQPVPVEDPYNLYFTPDGSHALVMAERLRRIDVRDAHTMKLQSSLPVPCAGVNHADYSADLSFFVASCEFSGKLLVVDRNATRLLKVIDLNGITTPGATSPAEAYRIPGSPKNGLMPGANAMPQDVRLTPDGSYFLAADMLRNGVWVIDAKTTRVARFIRTGVGAHGIYPSRDATRIFISNRDEGSVTVLRRPRWGQWQRGPCPAGRRPTWEGSAPTARSCGSAAAPAPSCTSWTQPPGRSRTVSRSTPAHTVWRCCRSLAGSASATPGTPGEPAWCSPVMVWHLWDAHS